MYSEKELNIMKDAIKQYEYLARNINHEIKEGATIESIFDYIYDNFNIDITNVDFEHTFKYVDFNYENINCSVIQTDKLPTTLSKDIEVWNDEDLYLIFDNINIEDLKKIVEDSTNETRNNSDM